MPLQQQITAAAHGQNHASEMVNMCTQAVPIVGINALLVVSSHVAASHCAHFVFVLLHTRQGPTLVLSISLNSCSSSLVRDAINTDT